MIRWIVGVVGIIAFVVAFQTVYIIDEGQQGVVTQFGQPVLTVTQPGLYAKIPFAQNLAQFEKRILSLDSPPKDYFTLERKRIVVDYVVRWRIQDPLLFFQSVGDEIGAGPRLDNITNTRMKSAISAALFVPIVRELRDGIMGQVTTEVRDAAVQLGITVEDVRIKRLDLPVEVQESVFERMRAERQRLAAEFRAQGEEQAREVRATADRDVEVILAGAFAEAQGIRGEGDAEAIRITGQAFGEDEEFYGFVRRLETYEKLFPSGTTVVLKPGSDLLKFLEGPLTADE